jgi:hypothetical protein
MPYIYICNLIFKAKLMTTKKITLVGCLAAFILMTMGISCSSSHKVLTKQEPKDMTFDTPPDGSESGMASGLPLDGKRPQGMPPVQRPDGKFGERPQRQPSGLMGEHFNESSILSIVRVKKGSKSKRNQSITASENNQSAVVAYTNSTVTLENNMITTTGNSSSDESSSFQGLNAAVLGRDESVIRMKSNSIKTSGLGANAVFAYGKSLIYSESDEMNCTGNGAHGLMASGGGSITASKVKVTTAGKNSGAIATDRGSGTITVTDGQIVTTGVDSPGIYSTGNITVSDSEIESTASEVAVIEGSNSIKLFNSKLLAKAPNKWGVMIYQSFSGDAEGADGKFEMENGSLKYTDSVGPLFFVTNSTAYITLTNVVVNCASGTLVNVMSSKWGKAGSNGGNVNIKTTKQLLKGNLIADNNSEITLSLKNNSDLVGAVNPDNKAKSISMSLDGTSTWTLTADSHVTTLVANISDTTVANIIGNGYTLFYKTSENRILEGKTFALKNGGSLKPE